MAAALAQTAAMETQLDSRSAQHTQELAEAAAARLRLEADLAQAVARGSDLAAQVAVAQTQAAR